MARILPVNRQVSQRWAMSNVESVGMIFAGRTVYDLVNLHTFRAHRMVIGSAGLSIKLPVSGSFTADDYVAFNTRRPMNFEDFNGIGARETSANVGIYSIAYLTLFEGAAYFSPVLAYVKWSGWGLSIPGAGFDHGVTEIVYGDGNALGDLDIDTWAEIDLPPDPEHVDDRIQITQHEERLFLKIPGDALFDFDKANIKREAEPALKQAGAIVRSSRLKSLDVFGYTDNIGSDSYNLDLSERRARTVAQWLTSHDYMKKVPNVYIKGWGKADPVAPNQRPDGSDDPAGRALNRRVEIILVLRQS